MIIPPDIPNITIIIVSHLDICMYGLFFSGVH